MLSSRIKQKSFLYEYYYLFISWINSNIYLFVCAKWMLVQKYVRQESINVWWMKIMISVYTLFSLKYTSRLLENFVD